MPLRKSLSIGIAGALAAGLLTAGNAVSPSEGAQAAPLDPVSCGQIYALDQSDASGGNVHTIYTLDTATGQLEANNEVEVAGQLNALGVDADSDTLWAATQGQGTATTVRRITASTGAVTTIPAVLTGAPANPFGGISLVMGAYHTDTDIYYFGAVIENVVWIYGIDGTTNTQIPGVIGRVPLGSSSNGDFAFDGAGRLYVTSDGVLLSVNEKLPTTGTSTGPILATTSIASTPSGSIGSMAFGADGNLYLGSNVNGTRVLYAVNPSSGEMLSTTTMTPTTNTIGDFASCASPNVIRVMKDLPNGRVADTDQFALSATGGGIVQGNTATTAGTDSGLQDSPAEIAGPVLGEPGETYTVTEAASGGTILSSYASSWSCVDSVSGAQMSSGTGSEGTFTMPDNGFAGADVLCTFSNDATPSELEIAKTSDATTDTRVGDTVTYTVTATNTGTGDYTEENPAVVFDDLSGVLDDATYNDDAEATQPGTTSYEEPLLSWAGPLAVGESVELTYTVTLAAGGDGEVRNVAWQPTAPENLTTPACDPATEQGTDPETGEPCAAVEYLLPSLLVEKVADRSDLPAVGESVRYGILVTNLGPGDYTATAPATMSDDLSDVLDSATYNDDATAWSGTLQYNEPVLSWSGALAAGQSAEIAYTATYTGEGDQSLRNAACVPEDETFPGTDPCSTVQIPGAGLSVWKQVESSDSPTAAGSVLTYTLFFENAGQAAATVDSVDDFTHVSDDADVTSGPVSTDGLTVARDGNEISITGTVPAGETFSVTYAVTVKPDGERGDDIAANFLLPPGVETPPTPECTDGGDRPDCTTTPIAAVDYAKSVEASSDPVIAGTVLTYTVTIDGTGIGTDAVPVAREDVLTGVLDDATVLEQPVSDTGSVTVTEIADGRFQIGGELAAGTTATVVYSVTVNDEDERGDDSADNFLVTPGDEPPTTCDEGGDCTVTPLPNVSADKTVAPESGTTVAAGQDVTYTLTFSNNGEAAGPVSYTDDLSGVLDDAALVSGPTSSDAALTVTRSGSDLGIDGTLAAGQVVTVEYTVTVGADSERGDDVLGNVLAETGIDTPVCGEDGVICTENPVPRLESWKTVEADPAPVAAGTVLTYTLHFENTGAAAATIDEVDHLDGVLDDADVTAEPVAEEGLTATRADDRIAITGQVPAGSVLTVTYQVAVKADGERGDDVAANFLVPAGEQPPGICEPSDVERADCTITPIGQLTVQKSVTSSTDVVGEGTELTYTLTFDNQGEGPIAVDHTDELSDVLDDADLTSFPEASDPALTIIPLPGQFVITGELGAGQTVTVAYTVTVKAQEERGNNTANNFLVPTGEEPPTGCEPGQPCTVTPLPVIDVAKSVDPASGTSVEAGRVLTYTLTFANTGDGAGAVDYTDLLAGVVDDADVTSLPTASDAALDTALNADDTIAVEGVLQPGQTATVTYQVTVKPDGQRGDNMLGNFLVESGEEPPVECEPTTELCTDNPIPEIEAWKTVAAGSTPVKAGTVLTYTLSFENRGEGAGEVDHRDDLTGVTDDADVTVEPTSSGGLTVARDGDVISITGPISAGETLTVTYQVTVKADEERGDDVAANFLVPSTEEPPPVCQPTDAERPDCTITPIGRLLTSKSVSASTAPIVEGTVLTYTLTFDNQGEGAVGVDDRDVLTDVLDDAMLTAEPIASDEALQVSAVENGQFSITGELEAGQTVTVTYQVTVNAEDARGDDTADNFLIPATGEPPVECAPADPNCTTTPLPSISSEKSADPESGTTVSAGQDITYILTFRNSGEAAGSVDYADLLDGVLDDAALTGAPVVSDPALTATDGADGTIRVAGILQPGQEVTVTYSVQVKADGDRGDDVLRNFLVRSGEEPPTKCTGDDCTEHRVPEIVDSKSVDPASGTPVVSGQELTYALTFRNDGAAAGSVDKVDDLTQVLDDADVVSEPVSSDDALTVARDGVVMSIAGSLEPGQEVTVTYTVKVRAAEERGDSLLSNYLLIPGQVPPKGTVCTPGEGEAPDCTINPAGDIVPAKSVDPASGTTVEAGDDLTYTLSFENVGAAPAEVDYVDTLAGVLDDATLTGDVVVSDGLESTGPENGVLTIMGTVQPGETASVTYTVTVNAYEEQGDHRLVNFLAPEGVEPPAECIADDPLCTENPVGPPETVVPPAEPQTPDLSATGGTIAVGAISAALLALSLGGGLLLLSRRRARHGGDLT